ncbi:MAG: hypothetical protein V4489_05810 [Chlamydiota bacterium]
MGEFSLDPSLTPKELPFLQNLVKKQEEPDLKKFESEMKKIKTDTDQKKQRKREEEENEGSKKIIQEAQDLIKKQEDSLYAVQKPDIKASLKRKKNISQPESKKNFLLPSLDQASLLFQKNDFTIDLSSPPSASIEREKIIETLGFQGFEVPIQDSFSDETEPSSNIESIINNFILPPPFLEKEDPLPFKDTLAPLEKILKQDTEENIKKCIEKNPCNIVSQPSPFFFSIPENLSTSYTNLHRLSPDTFALFERMVGVITVTQNTTGISETTLNLNQPQFASSVFFGSRITIEECDSAPKEFNIRFCGTEEAVKAFTAHKQELEIALTEGFENKRFRFKVQRIETDLSTK